MRPSRRASVVRQPPWDPTEKGLYTLYLLAVVIAGHSHKPALEDRGGVLFMNPGSIGPRRFTLPIAMGFLTVRGAGVRGRIVYLDP